MEQSPKTPPSTQTRLLSSLTVSLPLLVLAAIRFDYALALIVLFCTFSLALLLLIRASRASKAIILVVVLVATGGALYRFVSPCLFTLCVPTPWEEQRDEALRTIAGYGPDFAPYSVSAYLTRYSKYRPDIDPNLRVSFDFIRPKPAESEGEAPYEYHSVALDDRDPLRSRDFTPGGAWIEPVQLAGRASAFASVHISPREAIQNAQAALQTSHDLTINPYDTRAELLLMDAVPPDLQASAVWEVATKTYGSKSRWLIWIDANSGAVLKEMEHKS
jgi:hypothetical protein